MIDKLSSSLVQKLVVPTIVVVLVIIAVNVPATMADDSTSIGIDSSADSVEVGETQTFTVVVNGANGGVGAAEMAIAVEDPNVATITDVNVLGEGVQAVQISDDGSSADVDYSSRDTADTGTVPIIEVTVTGRSTGETGLSLGATAQQDSILLFNEEDAMYEIAGVTGATITVEDGPTETSSSEAQPTPALKTETPSADVSSTKSPSTETPSAEAPATEAPPTETPSVGASSPETTPSKATPSESAPETTLHLDPSNDNVQPGKTATYEVVVERVEGGVGAAELGIVVDDPNVATITDVTVFGSGSTDVTIAKDGSSADIYYAFRDTYDSGSFPILEVTVEGQSTGETGLSIEPAGDNEDVLLFDEQGTGYDVTGTTDATVTVKSGGKATPTPEPPADELDAFQIDLVQGDVISQLDPDTGDTYHKQERFITALHVTEDDHHWGAGSARGRTYQADGCEIGYSQLSFDPDTGISQVALSVSDVGGCEGITVSYVGYELPDGTTAWDGTQAEDQELKDSMTVTLHPGEDTVLTVDVIDNEGEQRSG